MLLSGTLHPMIDANESTFERQYSGKHSTTGTSLSMTTQWQAFPPCRGVAYLEFGAKAGELAAGRKVRKIRNIVWVTPIAVRNSVPKEVCIELKPSESTVRFEVFSQNESANKVPHARERWYMRPPRRKRRHRNTSTLDSVRARCTRVTDGRLRTLYLSQWDWS